MWVSVRPYTVSHVVDDTPTLVTSLRRSPFCHTGVFSTCHDTKSLVIGPIDLLHNIFRMHVNIDRIIIRQGWLHQSAPYTEPIHRAYCSRASVEKQDDPRDHRTLARSYLPTLENLIRQTRSVWSSHAKNVFRSQGVYQTARLAQVWNG
jgi:hypothetical protein